MIDIGLNLSNPQFDADRDAVVQRARDAGVEALILTGTDLAESRAAAELAQRWPGYAFSTAGVHPHDARHWDEPSGDALRQLAMLPQVVAIGECGLDFNRDFSPRPAQEARSVNRSARVPVTPPTGSPAISGRSRSWLSTSRMAAASTPGVTRLSRLSPLLSSITMPVAHSPSARNRSRTAA